MCFFCCRNFLGTLYYSIFYDLWTCRKVLNFFVYWPRKLITFLKSLNMYVKYKHVHEVTVALISLLWWCCWRWIFWCTSHVEISYERYLSSLTQFHLVFVQVDQAVKLVDMKNKESAYQAWLGYYNSDKNIGRDKSKLVELANEFSQSLGLRDPPAIPKLILRKMGLQNVPGLHSRWQTLDAAASSFHC